MPESDEVKKLHKHYKELIERKDKIIEELRKENLILLKLSLKQGEKNMSLKSEIEKKFK